MPRYFFDVRSNETVQTHGDGIEVQNLQLAIREAALALASAADEMTAGVMGQEAAIDIRGEGARILAEVTLNIKVRDIHRNGG